MQRWFIIISLFVCQAATGQISLNNCLQWFDKADKGTITTYFQDKSYKLLNEKDSSNLHLIHYSIGKTENGVQPHVHLFLNDSAAEYLSFEIYDQNEYKNIVSQLKAQHFQLLNADVNGNFITSIYDNDRFILNQDYESIENPLGKGQIPYYRYRIYQKYGKFDEMNGEKTVVLSENGMPYAGIKENYKNGFLSGERIFYYPDETIKRKENYQGGNGRLSGLVSDYNREGKLIHSVTYSYHWKYGMEKWYNGDGKVVKTLQWQRDLPVGSEKQTFNGMVVENIPYVKGVKQGLAKVPIYADEYAQFAQPLDTLNDAPIAVETVNYDKGFKTGKAVRIFFNETDTMYVGYYKAGKLDSVFTRYSQGKTSYTTVFVNGLENGARIYRIPSGPLKDTIHRIEHYKNGKLDGLVEQFYHRNQHESIQEKWTPNYYFETYKDGLKDGPYLFRQDSLNYSKGTYVNGKMHGLQEAGTVLGNKWVKTTRFYNMNAKTGEWITNDVDDSIVVTEQYSENQKNGSETKMVKGKLTEERLFVANQLRQIKFFDQGTVSYVLNPENGEKMVVTETLINGDTTHFFTYQFPNDAYPKSDTILAIIASDLIDSESLNPYLDGDFRIETKDYKRTGVLLETSVQGPMFVYYKKEGITEEINDDLPINHSYVTGQSQPYSGTFYSAYSNETISVENGLRNGWCIEYDKDHNETKRTKYKGGVAKKIMEKTNPQ